jgi:glutamate-1-semialdehyde 2,1-aminomutase
MPASLSQADLQQRAHRAIPAGCHTYSKGDDQFPSNAPRFLVRGEGSQVWDPDGNRFLDWGMGLRSVILGHAHPRVVEAATEALRLGSNFTRPSTIELEVAEQLIELIPAAEMVKFAKNGSDVTTAAGRLARAFTGRDLIAFPQEHPFYSFDDWFIGTTRVDAGVPHDVTALSRTFPYGDLGALEALLAAEGDRIAMVIMETATDADPPPGYLEGVRALTERHGVLLTFDEMITGFRWDLRGSQHHYGVTPDMATFGKAVANGLSVSALVGRRDVLDLGGIHHDRPRVFLLSATHGGETHALAAAQATIDELREQDGPARLAAIGGALQDALNAAARDAGVDRVARAIGLPCSPILAFDAGGDIQRSAGLRTLFLQETVGRGVLIPYIAPSLAHTPEDVQRTGEAAAEAFAAVRRVLDGEPLEDLLDGPIVKPVFRRYNAVDLDA